MLVTVQLTDHGERHVDAIIKTVFQYINMLKKKLPNKPFFEELVVCIFFNVRNAMKCHLGFF